jgi:hypothetical protein
MGFTGLRDRVDCCVLNREIFFKKEKKKQAKKKRKPFPSQSGRKCKAVPLRVDLKN